MSRIEIKRSVFVPFGDIPLRQSFSYGAFNLGKRLKEEHEAQTGEKVNSGVLRRVLADPLTRRLPMEMRRKFLPGYLVRIWTFDGNQNAKK